MGAGELSGSALLLQMSGVPGAGKSSIARALARARQLVVVDHDVVKTALLDGGVSFAEAGPVSYRVVVSLADDLLAQGHGVVIDSPCLYDELLWSGQQLADRHRAAYRYIECVVGDVALLDQRLRARTPMRSQRPSVDDPPCDVPGVAGADGAAQFRAWSAGMKRPRVGYLRLDTARALHICVEEALAFLDSN
jgi:predicted kinase